MTPQQFVQRWSQIQLKETAAAQSHFNDICALVGHAPPIVADPTGAFFTFEASTDKTGGGRGRADVWYRGRFIWEYKGVHADLDKAYQQLLLYRESLENPPLLITSDLQRIIHTNFTGTVKRIHEITFDRLLNGDGLALLKRAFYEPKTFEPAETQEKATQATAQTFVQVVKTLQDWRESHGDPTPPERLAHFVIRLFFCLFAEDLDLLPNKVFSQLVQRQGGHYYRFVESLRALFVAMRDGGPFGADYIPHFNGGLFDDAFVPELPSDIIDHLLKSARQDWSAIDPTIFGTLFERVIDEDKRAQLGAHYTSRDDILLIVEPVLMKPLRDEWRELRNWCRQQLALPHPQLETLNSKLQTFSHRLATIRVLDPACGSANFLYVSLRLLLDLQKEVIAFAMTNGLEAIPLTVSPSQLYGIEINPYAHELAQITVWIGYLQWRKENGFSDFEEPILRPLHNIEHKDAILAYDEQGRAVEPTWPEADVIVGNPPFLGGKKMKSELGDLYVDCIFSVYKGKVPHEADLVCYWFEKARAKIVTGKVLRAGLIATNSIRGGANRVVIENIKESGDIFMAWSDLPWILDGAAVRVSIIGFDKGSEKTHQLDGKIVDSIFPDLSSTLDLSQTAHLKENEGFSFMGVTPAGPFEIDGSTARKWFDLENSTKLSNGDVVRPYFNGMDITRRVRDIWIVDFGVDRSLEEARHYEAPFKHVEENVYPIRQQNNRNSYREKWWLFAESRSGMRIALKPLKRFIGTSMVSKHRFFQWLQPNILPANLVIVIARQDDYFFGVLHSRSHLIWALRQGTSLEDRPRYTPTTTFETYPFPWPPGQEPAEADDPRVLAIAEAARQLDQFRTAWLNPPATQEKTISVGEEKRRNNLTLTNLYNALNLYRTDFQGKLKDRTRWAKETKGIISLEEIDELDHIHTTLDRAVLAAYGWPPTLTDEQILERLLALNLARAQS
jgi:type II restriction/modification system DNA methylase subunit YeeA